MATLSQLRSRVLKAADSQSTTDADAYLNDGYTDVLSRTDCSATSVTKTLTAGDTTYSFTTDWSLSVLKILDVRYTPTGTTTAYRVAQASVIEVNDWNEVLPTGGFVKAYALLGSDQIILYPSPSAGDTLTLYYTAAPTALVDGTDEPSLIPSHWQDRLLVYYAAGRLLEDEDWQQAQALMTKYEAAVMGFTSFLQRRGSQSVRGMRAGYPDRMGRVPHDRSTYWSFG